MRKLAGDVVEFFRRATATPEHCAGWKSVSGLRLISARRDRGSDSADRLFSYDPLGAEEMDSPLARSADDESALAFTVVVPTYGRPEGLRSCLESLVAQRYPRSRFEVIVIDHHLVPEQPLPALAFLNPMRWSPHTARSQFVDPAALVSITWGIAWVVSHW